MKLQIITRRSYQRNKLEQICSRGTESIATDQMTKESDWVLQYNMLDLSKLIRKEILTREKWKFNGSFKNLKNLPLKSTLLRWIMICAGDNISSKNLETGIDRAVSLATQVVMQCTKTPRQLQDSIHRSLKIVK